MALASRYDCHRTYDNSVGWMASQVDCLMS